MKNPVDSKKPLVGLYKELNESQRKAVQAFEGPVLILAGAGSGKTRVLVCRIAALLLEGKCPHGNILAVTFTNKAAREMKDRVFALLSAYGYPLLETLRIGTFHSICAGILRENIHLLQGRSSVSIYDQGDQLRLIKKVLEDLNMDPRIMDPKSLRSQINLCKRMALGPNELHRLNHLYLDRRFEDIYRHYERSLRRASAFDFESLLFETHKLALNHPDFLKSLQQRFQYICVDEYQDTNSIQYLLLKQLAGQRKNICVVGDEDQSIYSWRGADISNIMEFEKDFKNCKVFFLEENYRSTQNIVRAANRLISHNKLRKGKTLMSQKGKGAKIQVFEAFSDYDEGRFVSQTIKDLCFSNGSRWDSFAALYRTNAQSRALEDHFRLLKIPYKIVGGVRFYDRREIKEILSYMKLLANTGDDVSFLSVINSPRRGMGTVFLNGLKQQALQSQKSLYECLKAQAQSGGLRKGGRLKLAISFIECIEELKSQKGEISLYELYKLLLDKSGYMKSLEIQNTEEAKSRMGNLQELGNVIAQKENGLKDSFLDLDSFLEEMSLLGQEEKTQEGVDFVSLMTLHNSKGLEFDTVFITGMEEGLLPSFQSIEDNNIEEERRLAYVGMTRAKERLFLSFARKRKSWGRDQSNPPSCFLSEIPEEFADHKTFLPDDSLDPEEQGLEFSNRKKSFWF